MANCIKGAYFTNKFLAKNMKITDFARSVKAFKLKKRVWPDFGIKF